MEDELGASLFERHAHRVSLAGAGQTLLERCQTVLRELEQTKQEIHNGAQGPSGSVALAEPPAAAHFLVPALVQRFGVQYPNAFLKLVGGFSSQIHEWLVRGQVDISCPHDPLPQKCFEITRLLREEVFLVGQSGMRLLDRTRIRIADLADITPIVPSRPNASRRLLDNWVARTRVTLNIRAEADDHSILRAMIRAGTGCALLTQGAFELDRQQDTVAGVVSPARLLAAGNRASDRHAALGYA